MYERKLVIDYLPPICPFICGFFVNKGSLSEDFDYAVFFRPLHDLTWLGIVIFMIISTSLLGLVLYFQHNPPKDFHWFSLNSFKMGVFVASMFSEIVWFGYNGAFTSELVKPTINKPFNDFESLALSNYRSVLSENYKD